VGRGGGQPPEQQGDEQQPGNNPGMPGGSRPPNEPPDGDGDSDDEYYEDMTGKRIYDEDYIPSMIPGTPVHGLSGVFTHLAKPINIALSSKYRDDPAYVNRVRQHMSKITSGYVHQALNQEEVRQLRHLSP
jgi:hypothetical protein